MKGDLIMNDVLQATLFLVLFFTMAVSMFFIWVCCAKLTTFNGSFDDGKFYVFSKAKMYQIKDSRIIGKILLIPVLIYVFCVETVAIVVSLTYLFLKSLYLYIFNKNETLKRTIARSYGTSKYLRIDGDEKTIVYNFLGYQWTKPYINTDLDW